MNSNIEKMDSLWRSYNWNVSFPVFPYIQPPPGDKSVTQPFPTQIDSTTPSQMPRASYWHIPYIYLFIYLFILLKTAGINSPKAQEARSVIKMWAEWVPSEMCEGKLVSCLSSSSWWFASNFWCPFVCWHISHISTFMFTCHYPSGKICLCVQILPRYQDTRYIDLWACPAPLWSHLNYVCNVLFPNEVTF